MTDSLTVGLFSPHVDGVFRLMDDGGPIDLTLIEAKEVGSASAAGSRQPFALLFRGPRDLVIAQQIYRLEHDELGDLELFLVPMQPDGSGTYFEAVFS